jgi:hypothetical protein
LVPAEVDLIVTFEGVFVVQTETSVVTMSADIKDVTYVTSAQTKHLGLTAINALEPPHALLLATQHQYVLSSAFVCVPNGFCFWVCVLCG